MPRSGPHLVFSRVGRRLSSITGFEGGWNAPDWEGRVLCRRPGPAPAPAGTDIRDQACWSLPFPSGEPCNLPQLEILRGSSAEVTPDLHVRLLPPWPCIPPAPRLSSLAPLTAGDRGRHREQRPGDPHAPGQA